MKNTNTKMRGAIVLLIVAIAISACGFHESKPQEQYVLEDIPQYENQPYVEINGNIPEFSKEDKNCTDAFEVYSELDQYGRCGQAYANICPELQPTKPRGEIGMVKPSGWHTVKYSSIIDGNYLYNRCHLIGYQLAGENANERNLITGTRYLNTIGMLPFENEIDDYVDETGNHVLYRVTPIYDGNNLVADGVQMEAWSVEDHGTGICFHIFCYNVQPGIEIDYTTGESRASESADATENKEIFVVNRNSKKYHKPVCSSVEQIAEQNRIIYTGTEEELQNQGFSACKRCMN